MTTRSHEKSGSGEERGWQREQRDDFTLSEAWHILWERRRIVAGVTLALIIGALAFSLAQPPVYTARAIVEIQPGAIGREDVDETINRLQNTVLTEELLTEAAERSGWEENTEGFNDRLEIEWQTEGASIMIVSFSASTPGGAAGGANAYADAFVERVSELENRLAGGSLAAAAGIRSSATPPDGRASPRPLLAGGVAGGAGLLLGGVVALLLENRTRRWRGPKDAALTLRAPVLGVIPDLSRELAEADDAEERIV